MSVLIKGMELPEHCWQCPFHDDVDDCILLKQSCMKVWGETKRLDDCPLAEIQPHGRLIDADVLKEKIWQARWQCQMLDDTQTADKIMRGIYLVEQILTEAPAIIPAEGGRVMTVEEWKRKNPPIQRKPITNADRIRSMTDEKLADLLADYDNWTEETSLTRDQVYLFWLAWLKQEAQK